MLGCLEEKGCDKSEVSSPWLLVDGASVEAIPCLKHSVDGIDVCDWKRGEENFVGGFNEFAVLLVPSGTLQIQTMDVDTFLWR